MYIYIPWKSKSNQGRGMIGYFCECSVVSGLKSVQLDSHPQSWHRHDITEVSYAGCESYMQFCFFYDSRKTAISATEEQLNTKHECQECHFVKRSNIIVPVFIVLVIVTLSITVVRKQFHTIVVGERLLRYVLFITFLYGTYSINICRSITA